MTDEQTQRGHQAGLDHDRQQLTEAELEQMTAAGGGVRIGSDGANN
jgi:hypothetical protein